MKGKQLRRNHPWKRSIEGLKAEAEALLWTDHPERLKAEAVHHTCEYLLGEAPSPLKNPRNNG